MKRMISLSFLLWLIISFPAHAATPASHPILRVETGMHTTQIRRVIPDLPRNRLITCSDDKTIRIWQMPQMRLLSVLRVPMDASHEGQLFAIAVSPDGKTVAAGGWTGWDWEGTASIYFFDTVTGEMVRRVNGFANVVNALSWTPDGRHLAVGLQGRAGFAVLRLEDSKKITEDTQYTDDLMDMDISPEGRVVTTALDGYVRLYDESFKLIARKSIPGGKKPISVRFSPDGARIAVGFIDTPVLSVISARDMSFSFHPQLSGLRDQAGFTSVTWSSDGNMLYATGDYRGEGLTPIYRWREGGRSVMERIPVARNRIPEIQQMPDNQIAFASEDPGLGVLGPEGDIRLYRGPDIVDFSRIGEQLLLSADGATVQYRLPEKLNEQRSFSVFNGGDQDTSASHDTTLLPPMLKAAGIQLEGWKNGYSPTLNGHPLPLEEYEMSRSYAIAPHANRVLLGTEWAVRLLNSDGAEIWHVKLPAVAWAVNISQDGQLAVAALSDGTLRWYRMRDGQEVLAYFPHGNGQDWIAWVPDGYYLSSIYGDNHIGWHLNRGKDMTPDFYRAVQFDRILYRPDVVSANLRAAMSPQTRGLDVPPKNADFNISQLRSIAPPRLKIQPVSTSINAAGQASLTLQLQAEKNSLGILDYVVFVNTIPVTPYLERTLTGKESQHFERTITIPLNSRDNEIRLEAFNGVSMGVAEIHVGLDQPTKSTPSAGDLYLLSIGANAFPGLPKRMHLAFAAKDAEDIAKTLQDRGAGVFKHIHLQTMTDSSTQKPDRNNVIEALKFVRQAKANDTVIIFLASHGLSDTAGNYYFVPRDVAISDIASAQSGGEARTLISWTTFFDALREASGKRVLIVDTCHARNIEGSFEAHSLMKRSASSKFALIVAAKGNEESQEYAPGEHGLFTYALLKSMQPGSDSDSDGKVSLREAFDSAVPTVEALRYKPAGPQTPQMVAPPALENLPLMQSLH